MIRLTPVRVIGPDNEQIGVIETREAIRMAQERGLDLVEISPDIRPPVCKIMDYGKYKYELSKKQQKNRAASKQQELKEVRLGRSLKIDPHDVQIRVAQARKFLMAGHKVQITQRFRGREIAHRSLGIEKLDDIIKDLSDIAKVEMPPRQVGRQTSLLLAPDKAKIESLKAKLAREKKAAEPESVPEEAVEEAVNDIENVEEVETEDSQAPEESTAN